MENQHRKISGYRELSQAEIDLMNRIKAFGPQLESLIEDVRTHVANQRPMQHEAADEAGREVLARQLDAEPQRWASIAKTDFQTGLMALTRAVAQPTFF